MQTKRFFIVVFLCFFSLFLLGCKKEKESSDQSYIYSLARNAGYEGTYEEWLQSIKGKDGKDGVDGVDGENGKTPYIGENGNWWIGDEDTGINAQSENGLSAYELYIKHNPNYQKTEEEWLDDLINGRLKSKVQKVDFIYQKQMYVNYKQILEGVVYPVDAPQLVTWEIDENSTANVMVKEKGTLLACSTGKVKIRAVSAFDTSIKSSWKEIEIIDELQTSEVYDLKGYEVVVMVNNVKYYDPFYDIANDPEINESDLHNRVYMQNAIRQAEGKYNFKIKYENLPYTSPWSTPKISTIFLEDFKENNPICDVALLNNSYIREIAEEKVIADVTDVNKMFKSKGMMLPYLMDCMTVNGKIYGSTSYDPDIFPINANGLCYNYGWLKKLGIEDPATMFNNGKWTYSNFIRWVMKTQELLGKNEYVLQGEPYDFWIGMTCATGVRTSDLQGNINLYDDISVKASNVIYDLAKSGCILKENNDSFKNGKTLMITANYNDLPRESAITKFEDDMWGEETTEYGYVPYPYPDNMNKEDTRISASKQYVYVYPTGRHYPDGLRADTYKRICYIMNEIVLTRYMNRLNDKKTGIEKNLIDFYKMNLSNDESVKAIMFYDENKIMFDANFVGRLGSDNEILKPFYNILYEGKDYNEEMDKIKDAYREKIRDFYS